MSTMLQAQRSCFEVFDEANDPTLNCSDAFYSVVGVPGIETFFDSDNGLLGSEFDGFDLWDDPAIDQPANLLEPFFSSSNTELFYDNFGNITDFTISQRGSVSMGTRESAFQAASWGSKSRITFFPFTTGGSTDPVIIDLDFSFTFSLADPLDNATAGRSLAGAAVRLTSDDPLEPVFDFDGLAELDLEFADDPVFFGDFDGKANSVPSGPDITDEFDFDVEFEEPIELMPDNKYFLGVDTFGSIFTDGFESGDTSVWTSSSTDTLVVRISSSNPNVRFRVLIEPRRGIYWDRSKNGHGFDFQRLGDVWFMLFYSYRDDGTPMWYLATGTLKNGVFTGTATQFDYQANRTPAQRETAGTGGPVKIDFTSQAVDASIACNDGTDRSSAEALGVFTFTLDGHQDEWCVERFIFKFGTPDVDFTGSWHSSTDDGWGLTIYTQGKGADQTVVVVIYYYDAEGKPRWALGVLNNPDFSGKVVVKMDQFSGYCLTCAAQALTTGDAGTVSLTLVQPSNSMDAGNLVDVAVNFIGAPGGSWTRTDQPIRMLSDLPDLALGTGSSGSLELYVTNMGDGSISVVDIENGSVIDTISVGTAPGHISIIPSLNRAYVADLGENKIHVINTTTREVVTSITISRPIGGIDVDATNGKVFVLDLGNGSPGTNMHVIDASNNTETADVTIGSNVQDIRIDSATNRAYVTDFNEGLKVIDLSNNSVLKTIVVANSPHGLAVDSTTNIVYITQVEGNTVSVVDVIAGSTLDTISVGTTPQWVALNTSRSKAYVTNEGDGTVSVIDTSTMTVIDTITVGTNPFFIIIDPSTDKAYVSNEGSNTVSVIDTTSNTVVNTISVGTQPIGLAIKP